MKKTLKDYFMKIDKKDELQGLFFRHFPSENSSYDYSVNSYKKLNGKIILELDIIETNNLEYPVSTKQPLSAHLSDLVLK